MIFMEYNGVVHHEFLTENQIVNEEYYLSCFGGGIRQKGKYL